MEHLDKDLQWTIKHFEEKFRQRDENLKAQAREYERRLDELNNENGRVKMAQEKSVSVDKFEGAINQLHLKLDQTINEFRKELVSLSDFKQKQEGRGQGGKDIMDIIKLVIIIAGFFIAYFVIKK